MTTAIELVDRVVALLILLYTQLVSRIMRLTVADVSSTTGRSCCA